VQIRIVSIPSGAAVDIDGDIKSGPTPWAGNVESGRPIKVKLRLAGYETMEDEIRPTKKTYGPYKLTKRPSPSPAQAPPSEPPQPEPPTTPPSQPAPPAASPPPQRQGINPFKDLNK
jgi:hypothetical protein